MRRLIYVKGLGEGPGQQLSSKGSAESNVAPYSCLSLFMSLFVRLLSVLPIGMNKRHYKKPLVRDKVDMSLGKVLSMDALA